MGFVRVMNRIGEEGIIDLGMLPLLNWEVSEIGEKTYGLTGKLEGVFVSKHARLSYFEVDAGEVLAALRQNEKVLFQGEVYRIGSIERYSDSSERKLVFNLERE